MIGITGRRSSIIQEFLNVCNNTVRYGTLADLPYDLDKYLFCHGVLHGKSANDISDADAAESFMVNYLSIVRYLDNLFECNRRAKVCIIGSESGFSGSYDAAYAGAKAALHNYVRNKRLKYRHQHLVCVAPTIIHDSGMTHRRDDLGDVIARGQMRRMGRWLNSEEVARVCNMALNEPSLCNQVIRMKGD